MLLNSHSTDGAENESDGHDAELEFDYSNSRNTQSFNHTAFSQSLIDKTD